jgi:hypothetical protein
MSAVRFAIRKDCRYFTRSSAIPTVKVVGLTDRYMYRAHVLAVGETYRLVTVSDTTDVVEGSSRLEFTVDSRHCCRSFKERTKILFRCCTALVTASTTSSSLLHPGVRHRSRRMNLFDNGNIDEELNKLVVVGDLESTWIVVPKRSDCACPQFFKIGGSVQLTDGRREEISQTMVLTFA